MPCISWELWRRISHFVRRNQDNRHGKNEDSEYFVNEFHCLTLPDLQTLNERHAGCGRPLN